MRKRQFKRVSFSALILAAVLVLVAASAAQPNGFLPNGIAPRGVPASVTSFGFGGHPGFHGVPASVTSIGFGGTGGFRGVPPSVTSLGFGRAPMHVHHGGSGFDHRHDHFGRFSPFYGGYYPYGYYGYYVPSYAPDDYDNSDSNDDNYQAGPTISDRGGLAARDYDDHQVLDQDYRNELNVNSQDAPQAAQPVSNQPETVLIFKDGHQVEVSNYAIVGPILYDLSDGRTRKVMLAELDLAATVRENDQRGVEFQLPAGVKAN